MLNKPNLASDPHLIEDPPQGVDALPILQLLKVRRHSQTGSDLGWRIAAGGPTGKPRVNHKEHADGKEHDKWADE